MWELTEKLHHSKNVQLKEVYDTVLLEKMEANVEQRTSCRGIHTYVCVYTYI